LIATELHPAQIKRIIPIQLILRAQKYCKYSDFSLYSMELASLRKLYKKIYRAIITGN